MAETPGGIAVTERVIQSPQDLGPIDVAEVEWFDYQTGWEQPAPVVPVFDQNAGAYLKTMVSQAPVIAARLHRQGLIDEGGVRHIVAQAEASKRAEKNAKRRKSVAGQTVPSWVAPQWDDSPQSHQLNLEDLSSTMDFIPIEKNIALEFYERDLFQENHIIGTTTLRTVNALTRRGWEFAKFKEDMDPEDVGLGDEDDEQDDLEIEQLDEWYDNVNSISDWREIAEHIAAFYHTTSNAYLEVIREELGNASAKPAGLDWAISSTMRVLKGHRGFIQWLAGQFRWFNSYMPRQEDREDGQKLWEEYWKDRGVDPTADEFLKSPVSRSLASTMPPGVWNPHLTEIMHFKDVSLSSKYYGFPRHYRLAKLNALLQYSLDYNIALQKNNRIPPFVILFHGKMSTEDRKDITAYFASLKGADNWGRVPVIQAPAGGGGPQGGAPRSGMEIVKVADEGKEGIFLELWARVLKDTAMHEGIPLDLLTTENSNRATVTEAGQQFNEVTIGRLHNVIEERMSKLTKYDLGCERRYLRFIDLDTDDQMLKAQEAQIWWETGTLSANEIRAEFRGMGPRPGGDEYYVSGGMAEDEEGEEESTARAKELLKNPAKLKKKIADDDAAQAAATSANTAGQQGTNNPNTSMIQQSDDTSIMWNYLKSKYG